MCINMETDRLILRPFEESDADSIYEYAKDERVGPIAGWPVHTSVENSLEIIRTVLMASETYAVCLKQDNRAIGAISILSADKSNLDISDREGEVGYWLGVPFWGQGIMPEAVNELLRHGFADLKLDTIWCGYFNGNTKSKRCQEKCGFRYCYTKRDVYWPLMNDIRTEHVTRLTKNEWQNSFAVRRLESDEIPAALSLAWDVFSDFEAPEYPAEGVDEFYNCLNDSNYLDGICFYGAFYSDKLIGMIGIRENTAHICFFFVDGRFHRLGLGTRLYNYMHDDFSNRSITVNSSPYGMPFYKSVGFIAADCEQTVNGIRFIPMIIKGV